MCGAPFPADALGGVVPNEIRYGFEDRYVSKSNALDEAPGSEREREHRVAAFALWRPGDRWALLTRLPYHVKQIRERATGEASQITSAHGLGDAEMLALIGLARGAGAHPTTLGLIAGGTAPTGRNDRRDDSGARLDEHLQPGTGAWSTTGGLHLGVPLGAGIVDGSVLGRWNAANPHHYRYGDAFLYNLGYTRFLRGGWRLIAQLNGRTAARDRQDGEEEPNTGGTVLYAAPGVLWQTGMGFDLEAATQIPVLESLDGIQDEHATARFAVSWSR